jgi:hypothetical protein
MTERAQPPWRFIDEVRIDGLLAQYDYVSAISRLTAAITGR